MGLGGLRIVWDGVDRDCEVSIWLTDELAISPAPVGVRDALDCCDDSNGNLVLSTPLDDPGSGLLLRCWFPFLCRWAFLAVEAV